MSRGQEDEPLSEDSEMDLNNCGWKVKMDKEFEDKRTQFLKPRLNQIAGLFGLFSRYLIWYLKIRREKRKPFIDGLKALQVQPIYGVPLGGIGGGTIGRGFCGEFCRFQLIPGIYEHHTVLTDQFIVCIRRNGTTVYQKVLSPKKPTKKLQSWKWGFDPTKAEYRALYPRAWYTYHIPEEKIELQCRQVSPIIPNDYKDSSLPLGVFIWRIQNLGNEPVDVTIAFTFKNGTGSRRDRKGGCWTETFTDTQNEDVVKVKGVLLHQNLREMPCTMVVSALEDSATKVSRLLSFDPNGNGETVWQDLSQNGCFTSSDEEYSEKTRKGEEIACAVAAQCSVNGNGSQEMKFCLAWDMPDIKFKAGEATYKRRYKRWFNSKQNGPSLASHALSHYSDWEKMIDDWQNPIVRNPSYPAWYKAALFNELYFVSDGGTLWVDYQPLVGTSEVLNGDVRPEYGQFAYLEGHEYRMYNTYDVHFYASFALAMLWPKLQLSLQYDMKDATIAEDTTLVKALMDGKVAYRKTANSVPHDIGDPAEAPWRLFNAYNMHDTAQWRDLNTKFVLQVYRDYVFTKDEQYLKNMWPLVKIIMEKCLAWDLDGDGLIENSGTADQTYDVWVMKGPSAYCGGLWLSSLCVTVLIAQLLGDTQEEKKFQDILERAKKAYHDKLWTGSYYKFDSSNDNRSLSIMADQLCGHWYLKASGVTEEVFPKENVEKALRTIYENNVLRFKDGNLGAVNGMMPNGKVDTSAIQSEEVWIGVTYSLAATMIHEGMTKEGFSTAKGIYTSVYDRLGLGFQTPEAVYEENTCRSLGYMRPLSIWAIQWALEKTTVKQI